MGTPVSNIGVTIGAIQLPTAIYAVEQGNTAAFTRGSIPGPFVSPANTQRIAVLALVQLNPPPNQAGQIVALVSTDQGSTWTTVNGPTIDGYIDTISQSFFGVLGVQSGETVYFLQAPTSGVFGLYSFDLSTFTFTTLNPTFATYDASGATVLPIGGIIAANGTAGIAWLWNTPYVTPVTSGPTPVNQETSTIATFDCVSGVNLSQVEITEPDSPNPASSSAATDWGQDGVQVASIGVIPGGTFVQGTEQTTLSSGGTRVRIMTWPADGSSEIGRAHV